jgi:hypothetical protein
MIAMITKGLVLRHIGNVLAAALLLLTLSTPASAASRATATATVRIDLRYDAETSAWRGSFHAVGPHGAVVARGHVLDRPRQKLGATWSITRRLTTRVGTLRFRISGRFQTPTAQLHWLIVGGTGAYAALHGHGADVEHLREPTPTATAVMRRVPLPINR